MTTTKATAPAGHKLCRVLKAGDGKVSKGAFEAEEDGIRREQYYAKGDEFSLPADMADTLENRGLVETQ